MLSRRNTMRGKHATVPVECRMRGHWHVGRTALRRFNVYGVVLANYLRLRQLAAVGPLINPSPSPSPSPTSRSPLSLASMAAEAEVEEEEVAVAMIGCRLAALAPSLDALVGGPCGVAARRVVALDVSRNCLRNLDGVDACGGLRSLSLYFNDVGTVADLSAARRCPALAELDVRLNPVGRLEPRCVGTGAC